MSDEVVTEGVACGSIPDTQDEENKNVGECCCACQDCNCVSQDEVEPDYESSPFYKHAVTELSYLPIPCKDKDYILDIVKIFSDQGHSGFSASWTISSVKQLINNTLEEIEFKLFGKFGDFDGDEDARDMQRMYCDGVKELVGVMKYFSGPYLQFYMDVVTAILNYAPVTSITFEDDQWRQGTLCIDDVYYQHVRAGNVFKHGDVIEQNDYYVFCDKDDPKAGSWYTGDLSALEIKNTSWKVSKCYLRKPFIDKVYERMNNLE